MALHDYETGVGATGSASAGCPTRVPQARPVWMPGVGATGSSSAACPVASPSRNRERQISTADPRCRGGAPQSCRGHSPAADSAGLPVTRRELPARIPRPLDARGTGGPGSGRSGTCVVFCNTSRPRPRLDRPPACHVMTDRGVLLGEQRASKTRGQGSNPCTPAESHHLNSRGAGDTRHAPSS
jgi:hypothetical protein